MCLKHKMGSQRKPKSQPDHRRPPTMPDPIVDGVRLWIWVAYRLGVGMDGIRVNVWMRWRWDWEKLWISIRCSLTYNAVLMKHHSVKQISKYFITTTLWQRITILGFHHSPTDIRASAHVGVSVDRHRSERESWQENEKNQMLHSMSRPPVLRC